MEEKLRVTPNCCVESTKYKIPYLDFPYKHKDYEKIEFLKNKKPKWCIKGIILLHDCDCESVVEIKFCPFCSKNLPDIELNPLAKRRKIYNTDSGDYCESCQERSTCCDCLPAPFRWRPIGSKLKLPKKVNRNEDDDEDY